jgi:ABC-type nitrate/sulfonate/bicarbonate transport system permease component
MSAAVLSVGDEPLQWLQQGDILTLTQAENSAPEQAVARNWRRTIERAGPALLIVVLVVLWQILTRAFDIPKFLLPAPTDIASLMVDEWPLIQMHSLATIGSIVSGYITAVLFALAISALMIRLPLVERLIMPIFVGLQSVPKIAIAPLILVWVGAGMGSKIAVVASIAFFPIVINTMAGFKEVDRGLADVFRSVDANERQMFFRLRLPYAMPYIFAGLRIATTLSVLGAIVAEWLAASNGLGYLVLSGSFNFNTARSFAAIIVLAVIGTAFFAFMSWIERMISWKREGSDSTTQV